MFESGNTLLSPDPEARKQSAPKTYLFKEAENTPRLPCRCDTKKSKSTTVSWRQDPGTKPSIHLVNEPKLNRTTSPISKQTSESHEPNFFQSQISALT